MSAPHAEGAVIAQAVANLDAWLDTMRVEEGYGGPRGYGGPVVHWWQACLSYTGPGLDWRYEGIILGYLTLWQRTGEPCWLEKACRAGNDLMAGQLPNGNGRGCYRASSFELNPYPGGTPGEAAADLGLLRLALALRAEGDGRWERYAATAECNLRDFYLEHMWDPAAQAFRDAPDVPSFVPNKACTLVEALFAWAELRGDAEPIERYALPTLKAVVAMQVTEPGALAGGIAQNSIRGTVVTRYFPYYIARCVPALLLAYDHTGLEAWLEAAAAAFGFVARRIGEDGLLPQVVYPRGTNRYPPWIAGLGDVLRAGALLEAYSAVHDLRAMRAALLAGQLPTGGFATARGFGAQVSQRTRAPQTASDFRDGIAVVGWSDKAFRYLASQVPEGQLLPDPAVSDAELPCQVRGWTAIWRESGKEMSLEGPGGSFYRWRKGQPWADVVAPEVMWK